MKARKSSKKKLGKLKPAPGGAQRPRDLRTKAGRAWKAEQAQKALRARARARAASIADAAKAVTGSWVDLNAHAAKKIAEVQAAAEVCGLSGRVLEGQTLSTEVLDREGWQVKCGTFQSEVQRAGQAFAETLERGRENPKETFDPVAILDAINWPKGGEAEVIAELKRRDQEMFSRALPPSAPGAYSKVLV